MSESSGSALGCGKPYMVIGQPRRGKGLLDSEIDPSMAQLDRQDTVAVALRDGDDQRRVNIAKCGAVCDE